MKQLVTILLSEIESSAFVFSKSQNLSRFNSKSITCRVRRKETRKDVGNVVKLCQPNLC